MAKFFLRILCWLKCIGHIQVKTGPWGDKSFSLFMKDGVDEAFIKKWKTYNKLLFSEQATLFLNKVVTVMFYWVRML